MEDQEEENKEDFVDSRVVKTVRSLRKGSAKKNSSDVNNKIADNDKFGSNGNPTNKRRVVKKKSLVNGARVPIQADESMEAGRTDNGNVTSLHDISSSNIIIQNTTMPRNVKYTSGKSEPAADYNNRNNKLKFQKPSNAMKGQNQENGENRLNRAKGSMAKIIAVPKSGVTVQKNGKNLNNDSMTPISSGSNNNGLFMTTTQSRQASREGTNDQNISIDKNINGRGTTNEGKKGTAKRLPPGVRLYNQSKNKSNVKGLNKSKKDEPPKPVLTKKVEEMLVQSNREKCEEIIKSSNAIHELLNSSSIDKQSMIDALFSDALFNHSLANLLFHSKILGKNKLENFLHDRVKQLIREYDTDRKIKENLNQIHSKIQDKIEKLKKFRQQYSRDFDKK